MFQFSTLGNRISKPCQLLACTHLPSCLATNYSRTAGKVLLAFFYAIQLQWHRKYADPYRPSCHQWLYQGSYFGDEMRLKDKCYFYFYLIHTLLSASFQQTYAPYREEKWVPLRCPYMAETTMLSVIKVAFPYILGR